MYSTLLITSIDHFDLVYPVLLHGECHLKVYLFVFLSQAVFYILGLINWIKFECTWNVPGPDLDNLLYSTNISLINHT